jgi:hypothetical protein
MGYKNEDGGTGMGLGGNVNCPDYKVRFYSYRGR